MKKKFFSVLLILVLACSFSLVTAVPVAAQDGTYLGTAPTIDGDLSEWEAAGTQYIYADGCLSGEQIGTGKLYMAFDDDNFYLAYKLEDAGPGDDYLYAFNGGFYFPDASGYNSSDPLPSAHVLTNNTLELRQSWEGVRGAEAVYGEWMIEIVSNNAARIIRIGSMQATTGLVTNLTSYAGSYDGEDPFPGSYITDGLSKDLWVLTGFSVFDNHFGQYSVAPPEVWVDDGGNDANLGTENSPFATIQKGIDIVATGGTVNVAAGLYNERLTISNSLDLHGARYGVDPTPSEARTTPADESVITEAGLPDPNPNLLIGIANGVSGVTLDGFTLIGDPIDPNADTSVIRCGSDGSAYDITISNNIIDGKYGVIYKGGDTLAVHQNRMVVNKVGVVVQPNAATDVTISDNVITLGSTPADDDEQGVYMTGCSQSSVTGNTITGFIHSAALAGSHLDHLTVSGNTFTGNARGVSIWGISTFITISNNVLSDSVSYEGDEDGCGVSIKGSDLVITGNQINKNANIGVRIDRHAIDTERVTISNNNIVDNANYGVWVNTSLVTEIVDATLNWWGDVSGPEQATTNPDAIGDEVSVKVTYSPWLGATKGTSPMTFIVDDVGPEPAAGYIQTAIDAANPAGGDTIDVAAGAYTENVVIDKWLTLQGAGKTATIIDASGASANGILLEAGGTSASQRLTIKGFTIKNAPSHGIRAYKAGGLDLNYVTFEDLVLTLNTNGMEIHNDVTVSDMEITHCEFVNNEALGLSTASNVIVDGMAITDSKFNGNKYGIYLEGTINGVTILRSFFNDNIGASDGSHGAYMTETGPLTNLLIEDSEFKNNSGCGLMVWNEQDNAGITIRRTSFQDNAKWGVLIWGNTLTNVLIEDSTVLNNDGLAEGYYGIDFNTYDEVMTNVAVHFTDITGHTVGGGVKNRNTVATAIVDATNNWWDDVSGPTHASNALGTGDPVTDNVNFSPWLGATFDTEPMTFVELVTSADPDPVTLLDEDDNTIATVDISGGDASSGTIAAYSEPSDPEPGETSLHLGTGKTGVVFLDIKVTGYASGMAHIIVPYSDADVEGVAEDTLGLYYWDDDASMWRIAANSQVDTGANIVSGDIPVSALSGTPIGMGAYPADEATVAIESITNLTFSGNDVVALTITTKDAQLGAANIDLTYDNTVVEVLGGENSDFDSLTVNPEIARFVANQLGASGVDATGEGAVLAQVRLKAVGNTGSSSPLTLTVITLKDNDGITIPIGAVTHGTAIIGGLGDANSDGAVDVYDCVFIARAIAEIPGYSVDDATMNVDGKDGVDVFDCTHLARHIAGIPSYELGG